MLTSDITHNTEIDEIHTQIFKANAVLRELYLYVVRKREFSNTAKLSVFKSVFMPILTYAHESWVMAERAQSQVRTAEIGCLQRVHDGTRRDTSRQSAQLWNRKALNVEPLIRIETPYLRWFDHVARMPRKDWRGKACRLHPWEKGPEVNQRPGDVITPPTLRGPVLVWSQQNYLKLLRTVRYFEYSHSCCHSDPPQRKSGYENEWMVQFSEVIGV